MKKDTSKIKKTRLIEPEMWEDPSGRKVISEYHKENENNSKNNNDQEPFTPPATEKKQSCEETRIIDISSIEVMTYALSRAIFRRGLQIPLKFEGVVDMDISMKDADVILNTNNVYFEPPPLKIWRIIFSYKGKPVFEYGRGVKNNLKIYYRHALVFLITMWIGGRKSRKAKKQKMLDACQDLADNPPEKIQRIKNKKDDNQ